MSEFRVMLATVDNAAEINAIYNHYIATSVATFDLEQQSTEDRRALLVARAGDRRYPTMVAVDADKVVGFAGAAPFDPRGAYRTSVKTSVFLAPSASGRGLGRSLYAALFRALEEADVHRAYGLIVAPNPASRRLHEAFGFHHVATLSEVGRKFGRYLDVEWFEKRL